MAKTYITLTKILRITLGQILELYQLVKTDQGEYKMPQGKGTYGSKVGRPPKKGKAKKGKEEMLLDKKGLKGKKKPSAAVIIAMNKGGQMGKQAVRQKMGFMNKGGKVGKSKK